MTEHAVSLKLPTFWTAQPEVWFAQTEAQFRLRKIDADETRYYYTVAALDQDTAIRVLDLNNPPDSDKYRALKSHLLDTFGLSPRQRASRLLHFRPLGDSKPSALMDEMLALVADHTPCPLFEQLFLERLPDDIRIQLVDTKFDDLRHLARRADALWSCRDMELSSVNVATQRSGPRQASPGHKPSKTDYPSRSQGLCFYHRTFGEDARRCRHPCIWPPAPSGKNQAGR